MSSPSVGVRLFSHGAVYTAGVFLMRAGNFLLLPVYTALLTTAEYGVVGVLKQATQVLVLLALCGQTLSMLRLGIQKDGTEEERGALAGTLITFVFVLGLLISCAAAVTWPLYKETLDGIPLVPLGIAALSWVATTAVFRIILANLQQREHPRQHTALNLLRWLLLLVFVGLFVVWLRWGAFGLLLATSLSFAGGALLGLRYLPRTTRFAIDRPILRTSLAYGLPIVPHALAGALLQSADRIILTDYRGLSDVGLYTLAANLGSIVAMVSAGMHRAWSPFFLRVDAQGEAPDWTHVRRLSFFSLSAVGAVCLAVGLGSPLLIDLAATDAYVGADRTAAILALAAFLNAYYLIGSVAIFAEQKAVRWIAAITIPAMLLNIVLNLRWIPEWGIEGAAVATLVSSGVLAVSAGILGRHTRKVPFKYVRAGLLLVLVTSLLWYGLSAGWLVRVGLFFAYVVALFVIDWRDLSGAARSLLRQLRKRLDSA